MHGGEPTERDERGADDEQGASARGEPLPAVASDVGCESEDGLGAFHVDNATGFARGSPDAAREEVFGDAGTVRSVRDFSASRGAD